MKAPPIPVGSCYLTVRKSAPNHRGRPRPIPMAEAKPMEAVAMADLKRNPDPVTPDGFNYPMVQCSQFTQSILIYTQLFSVYSVTPNLFSVVLSF